jgi:hypothetical protein
MTDKTAAQRPCSAICTDVSATLEEIYTIFEGISDAQRAVIASAVCDMYTDSEQSEAKD